MIQIQLDNRMPRCYDWMVRLTLEGSKTPSWIQALYTCAVLAARRASGCPIRSVAHSSQ